MFDQGESVALTRFGTWQVSGVRRGDGSRLDVIEILGYWMHPAVASRATLPAAVHRVEEYRLRVADRDGAQRTGRPFDVVLRVYGNDLGHWWMAIL